MSKAKLLKICVGVAICLGITGFFSWESGYQFYLAEGLSVDEVIQRHGAPLETHGSVEGNDLSMIYYSTNLNVVELSVNENRVVSVDLRIAD